MSWFTLAILSGLCFAISRLVVKHWLSSKTDTFAFTIWHDLVAALVIVPLLFGDFAVAWDWRLFFLMFLIVLFSFMGDFLGFVAIKKIDVSLIQILTQIRHILALLIGAIFFAEVITISKLLAVVLIILGVLLVVYKKEKFVWGVGEVFAILSTVAVVVAIALQKLVFADITPDLVAFISLFGVALFGLPVIKFDRKRLFKEYKRNTKGILVGGAFFGLFIMLLYRAIEIGEFSRVVPVNQVSLVFIVLGGIILLREYDRLGRKLLGLALTVVGIVILNFL